MPQKVLRFTGINRKVNEFHADGACEELINLRPSAYGVQVIKNKVPNDWSANDFKSIVVHEFGARKNILAVTDSSVLWISDSGIVEQVILNDVGIKNVAYAGNIIIITLTDGGQHVFEFKNDEYSNYSVSIPVINISVELTDFGVSGTHTTQSTIGTLSEGREVLSKAYSNFYNSYPHGLAGPILIGCTYELEDGSEVWSSGFSIIDPTKDNRYQAATCNGLEATVYGARKAKLKFNIENYKSVSGVKNIKFYSSLPLASYEVTDSLTSGNPYTDKLNNNEINIAGQQMYLQKVISFRINGEFELTTEHILAANELMPVTSGTIYRAGNVVSYNNRFHFFNSTVEHIAQRFSYGIHSNIELPEASYMVDIRKAYLYVVIDNGEGEVIISDNIGADIQYGASMDFIYPMGGIKRGYIRTINSNNETHWYEIEFSDSSSYNFSCAIDYNVWTPCPAPDLTNLIESHGQKILWRKETNAINVSAPFNPFVFPVEYSYSVNGEIIDLATSYLPISSTQVGQYPLTIFATSGIYALEQGDGSVLYKNITPLQPLVIDGKPTTTPYGTFFISSNGLYLLSGRESVNLSYILEGKRELDLRDNKSYQILCCSNNSMFYNFTNLLSSVDFNKFVIGATITYDKLHNEIYICNASKAYSYVFNLDTKSFHKAAKRYIAPPSGSRYVVEVIGDTRNVVDMYTEESAEQPILLQSRPLSLEMLYTHIQRLVLLTDSELTGKQHLCISVFASDNLNDWKCIISSQKKDVVLRQIRTNRAAKSFKDYIIVINGIVHSDTDISDIIADYTVVNRRLG